MSEPRKLPANYDPLDVLERWVRAEMEIHWAEAIRDEPTEVREELLGDFLSRICTLRSRDAQAALTASLSASGEPEH